MASTPTHSPPWHLPSNVLRQCARSSCCHRLEMFLSIRPRPVAYERLSLWKSSSSRSTVSLLLTADKVMRLDWGNDRRQKYDYAEIHDFTLLNVGILCEDGSVRLKIVYFPVTYMMTNHKVLTRIVEPCDMSHSRFDDDC